MTPRTRDIGQKGLTLVELMVAMFVSSILIVFMLGAQTQLSQAFRGQTIASDVSSNLRMAAGALRRDLVHAGYLLPGGAVEVAPGVAIDGQLRGLTVRNNAHGDGPDELYLIFANDRNLTQIDDFQNNNMIAVADTSVFPHPEIVVLGTPRAACLAHINGTNDNFVNINPAQGGRPFNHPGGPPNPHCEHVRQAVSEGEPGFIYSMIGRGYRLDPARPELGVLQMSPTAGLIADDWIDVGVGFTNLQVATLYYERGRTDDLDGSGDPERNWYSGDNQASPPQNAVPLAVSLSLETRNLGRAPQAATPATPAFTHLQRPEHNPLGDWGQPCPGAALDPCGVDLANTSDADRPDRYRGEHVYRWTTITVNLRNMGLGHELVAIPGGGGNQGGGRP
jgi:prepilin-type N-terminal cleavage/methylation domain-containing protein